MHQNIKIKNLIKIIFIFFIIFNGNYVTAKNNNKIKIKIKINHKNNNFKGKKHHSKKYKTKRKIFRNKSVYFINKKINLIIQEAETYLKTPYKYGGNSRSGMDCSSFITNIFEKYNIILPRISCNQAQKGSKVNNVNDLREGDLLFFSTGDVKKEINHVGLILKTKNKYKKIYFIHSCSSNGVIISDMKEKYWGEKFITARRIIK